MEFTLNLTLALPTLPSFTMDFPELPPTLALALLIFDALLLAGILGYLPQLRATAAAPKLSLLRRRSSAHLAGTWPRTAQHAALPPPLSRSQPSIESLLRTHAEALAALRAELADEAAGWASDDLWLLRFCLSHRTTEKAADAARATLRYRAANSDLLRRAMEGGGSHEDALGALNKQALLPSPTLLGEPVHVVRAAASDVKKLMDDFTEEEVVDHLNLSKERAFLRCDAESRRSGRLVKLVSVLDIRDGRLSDLDLRFLRALGRASAETEKFYPQLLGLVAAVNAPRWVHALVRVASHFVPERTMRKVKFCGATDTAAESAATCPFASRYCTPDGLTDFLGGRAAPEGCLRLHT